MSNAILHSSQYRNFRRIDLIVIHCSVTCVTQRYTVDCCRRDHRARGFADIGYHYYITRDGVVHAGRALYQVGCMPPDTTNTLSVSATKEVWTSGDGLVIPEHRSRKRLYAS